MPDGGKCLSMLVRDSGHGVDSSAMDVSGTVGLRNVSERVGLFDKDASFQVFSEVGSGTCCTFMIPIRPTRSGKEGG
jgi:sensor histidine kinase YesM